MGITLGENPGFREELGLQMCRLKLLIFLSDLAEVTLIVV